MKDGVIRVFVLIKLPRGKAIPSLNPSQFSLFVGVSAGDKEYITVKL
jgi:hypothetical protein